VISKNFVSGNLRLRLKVRVGLVYCEILGNQVLALKRVLVFSQHQNPVGGSEGDDLILRIGYALSYAHRPPMMVVVTFLATLQALHRITLFQIVQESAWKE